MLDFLVDLDLCKRCGLCVDDCPMRIIEQGEDNIPQIIETEAGDCMGCQHCLAVCPTGALSVFKKKAADSLPLDDGELPTFEQMSRLIRGRRSVRNYEYENVDSDLVQRLLKTIANAPTGVNRQELTFTVIDDCDKMQSLRETAMDMLAAKIESGEIPEENTFLRRLAEAYHNEGRDLVFRGAPHALIVSAPPDAPCATQDVTIALAYFELLAQSAGLGTVWCGLMSGVLEALPELKDRVGLPRDVVHYEMLFGKPKVHYSRTVQRDEAAAIRALHL